MSTVDDALGELLREERRTKLRRVTKLTGTFGWSEDRAKGFVAGLAKGRGLGALDNLDAYIDRICDRYIEAMSACSADKLDGGGS